MLDQNTDRMWYVIGAVLIGAAIIFGMNTLMPQTFASVGGMFNDTVVRMSDSIYLDDVDYSTSKNLDDYIEPRGLLDFNKIDDGYYFSSDGTKFSGIRINADFFEKGSRYHLSFDMQKQSGDIVYIGGHSWHTDNVTVWIDGVYSSNSWVTGEYNPISNDYDNHHIDILFDYTGEHDEYVDQSIFIQPNRVNDSFGVGWQPYGVNVTNIELITISNDG